MRRLAFALLLLLLAAAPRQTEAQTIAEQLRMRTAAQLAALTPLDGATRRRVYICSDCASSASCTTGGGSTENVCKWNGAGWSVVGGSGAPTGAQYLTLALDAGLSAERTIAAGLCLDATDGGANSTYTLDLGSCSSVNVATAVTDETGTGALVLANAPTLVDPLVGGVQMCLEDGTNCPGGGSGTVEYDPDNYPPTASIHASQTDEFSNNTSTLTWTGQNLDSMVPTNTMDGMHLSSAGTTDAWHGLTTPMTSDTDWWMFAKIQVGSLNAATRGCGISIISEGSAAVPTEINSIYIYGTSTTTAIIEHLDHDDYDFAGLTSILADTLVSSGINMTGVSLRPVYVYLNWIAATDDIGAGWSWNGINFRAMTTDTTVGTATAPIALGIFTRDDATCFFEWVRTFSDPNGAANINFEVGS